MEHCLDAGLGMDNSFLQLGPSPPLSGHCMTSLMLWPYLPFLQTIKIGNGKSLGMRLQYTQRTWLLAHTMYPCTHHTYMHTGTIVCCGNHSGDI